MAGGKRFRFTGSLIAVLTDFAADSPSDSITAITKANPPVVTSTAHGRTDGDVVKITNVLGMVEANDTFIIHVINANTYSLVDTDGTAWGTYSSGGKVNVATFSNFCELTGYSRTGGTSPQIDADSLCSTSKEYELGFPDQGTTKVDYNFAPRTTVQVAIQSFYRSGALMAVKITLPNSGGIMVQMGFVQQTSEQVGRGGLWTGSMTIQNTGPRFDAV